MTRFFFISERYKLHFHKQKKKLRKLFVIGMVLKSKISLLFQLMSAHFQIKFFIIAVLGLIISAVRLWFDIKRVFQPNRVVYYEHAQHQHHYDHDDHDDHGYWARSSNEAAGHNLAYSAHAPKQWNLLQWTFRNNYSVHFNLQWKSQALGGKPGSFPAREEK